MPTVWIPPLLQHLTDGQRILTVPGETILELISELEKDYPGIQDRLCEDGRLRPGISITVDSVVSNIGLRHRLSEMSEVHFLPAISGG